MNAKYTAWIASYVERQQGFVLGACRRASDEIRAEFPELCEVRGHVFCVWGKRGHVWCIDPDGNIVDPTRVQFPGPIEYEPWKPGDVVCVGRCMNCGDEIWSSVPDLETVQTERVCSDACDDDLRRQYA
jgi:hypothetical protein